MVSEKLRKIRDYMQTYQLDAYFIPGSDPHANEYLPDCWKRREFISGFTGSAGDVVILKNKAGLWTDSRYFIQAEQQLANSGIDLYKMGLPRTPTITDFLVQELPKRSKIGIDPAVLTHKQFTELKSVLDNYQIEIVLLDENLVDLIWEDQPTLPLSPIAIVPLLFTGETFQSKIQRLREALKKEGAQAIVISKLDAIAWLLNIRGKDILYNPVVISYLIVTRKSVEFYVDPRKVSEQVQSYFQNEVKIYNYEDFFQKLKSRFSPGTKILLDPSVTNQKIYALLEKYCYIIEKMNPVEMMKARKNNIELEGFRNAHIRDGVAMVKFLHWLEKEIPKGNVTELRAEEKLEEFRREQKYYMGPSFRTISAFAEHGAIVHYTSSKETNSIIKPDGIFLLDSGGQYLDGTTDITRTIAIGTPTPEQKKMFTLVLKGMIDLTITPFPYGTVGKQLDTIARLPLWREWKNYGHGTGHGIGHFLNVHEGPHAISYYRDVGIPLLPGMITSNEPGYYKEDEYGIRIENILYVTEPLEKEFIFLTFDTLTLCPIDLNLVEKNLLSAKEIEFLNKYHQKVYKILSPFLTDEEEKWLKEKTRPI